MKKILIIDDDKDLLYGLNAILKNKGYEIKTLADGTLARGAVKNFIPDVILLDVNLAKVDGRDICKEFKHNDQTSHIPILMISADSEAGEVMNKCPADAFMAKPLSLILLYNKIESLIA